MKPNLLRVAMELVQGPDPQGALDRLLTILDPEAEKQSRQSDDIAYSRATEGQ